MRQNSLFSPTLPRLRPYPPDPPIAAQSKARDVAFPRQGRSKRNVECLGGYSKKPPARPQRARPRGVHSEYVEGKSDVRTKLEAFFSIRINGTGDLALWWEVARVRRLGRRNCYNNVAARKTRARPGHASFQSWETSSIPRRLCSSRRGGYSGRAGCYPVGLWCRYGTASGDPASTTDEKPALASAGLTNQVESRRPYPPSSLREVIKRPG